MHFFAILLPFKKQNEAFFFCLKGANSDRLHFTGFLRATRLIGHPQKKKLKLAMHDCKSIKKGRDEFAEYSDVSCLQTLTSYFF